MIFDKEMFGINPWKIIEKEFHYEQNEIAESVFSLSNEYMGCRGVFEEGVSGNTNVGCYIGGIFYREKQHYQWKRRGFPDYSNSIANTTNRLLIRISIDGEEFYMDKSSFSGYCRELDMKNGILKRRVEFITGNGERTLLKWERFCSHNNRHIFAQRVAVKALNHKKEIKITFLLDKGIGDYSLSNVHSVIVSKESKKNDIFILVNVKTSGQYYINRMCVETNGFNDYKDDYFTTEQSVGYSIVFIPEENREYHFDKIVSVWTNRDAGSPYGLISKEKAGNEVDVEEESRIISFLLKKSKEDISECVLLGYKTLEEQHIEAVSSFWKQFDINIIGDDAAQQGIRFSIFQLCCTYSGNDRHLNIGPKGYSGVVHDGRAFWDSESYCLPFYLFSNAKAAQNLIEYRYNTLEDARKKAKELGYNGALYPWTTIDGTEDCPLWEYAFSEIHINCIIAYAIFIYTHLTEDMDYLHKKGIEILIELARFWADRAVFVTYRNGYVINRVTGPDEYQQWVNNNFYTNFMTRWQLNYTIDTIRDMDLHSKDDLSRIADKLNLDNNEIELWQKIADNLIINYNDELCIYEQDDSFLSLDTINKEEIIRRDIPLEKKWTIEKIWKSQVLKQPDVLLAMFLLPHYFSSEDVWNNYKFYEQRTIHDSSLSPCIHSILACRIGRYNQAYDYYLRASRLDLENINNNTDEGLHISSMAGSWLNIVCGFGGMDYTGKCVEFNPILPSAWQKYSFKVMCRGSVISVDVDTKWVRYRLINGNCLNAKIYGKDIQFSSQEQSIPLSLEFTNRAEPRAVVFDLDGVIVDTAKYHYLAWKYISEREGIYFDEKINERLKGVDRNESLKIIIENSKRIYSETELVRLADEKNRYYVNMLDSIGECDILVGIREFIDQLHQHKIKTAIFSVSKNTDTIVKKLKIEHLFDAVVSGNDILRSKPDPEGFTIAAERLSVLPRNCVVIEDSVAGIIAASKADMKSIGIGDKLILHKADYVLPSTKYLKYDYIKMLF